MCSHVPRPWGDCQRTLSFRWDTMSKLPAWISHALQGFGSFQEHWALQKHFCVLEGCITNQPRVLALSETGNWSKFRMAHYLCCRHRVRSCRNLFRMGGSPTTSSSLRPSICTWLMAPKKLRCWTTVREFISNYPISWTMPPDIRDLLWSIYHHWCRRFGLVAWRGFALHQTDDTSLQLGFSQEFSSCCGHPLTGQFMWLGKLVRRPRHFASRVMDACAAPSTVIDASKSFTSRLCRSQTMRRRRMVSWHDFHTNWRLRCYDGFDRHCHWPIHGDIAREDTRAMWVHYIRMGHVAGFLAGPPCNTWSRVRAVQIADQHGPRVIRTPDAPWGINELRKGELHQVTILRPWLLALAMYSESGILEHPKDIDDETVVSIWRLPALRMLLQFPGMCSIPRAIWRTQSKTHHTLGSPPADFGIESPQGHALFQVDVWWNDWQRQQGAFQYCAIKGIPPWSM